MSLIFQFTSNFLDSSLWHMLTGSGASLILLRIYCPWSLKRKKNVKFIFNLCIVHVHAFHHLYFFIGFHEIWMHFLTFSETSTICQYWPSQEELYKWSCPIEEERNIFRGSAQCCVRYSIYLLYLLWLHCPLDVINIEVMVVIWAINV